MRILILAALFQPCWGAWWQFRAMNVTEWLHQSSIVVDGRLYIHGGEVWAYNSSGFLKMYYYAQTVSIDLTSSWTNISFDYLETSNPNLLNPVRVPNLWYNPNTHRVHSWGGSSYFNDYNNTMWSFAVRPNGSVVWEQEPSPTALGLGADAPAPFGSSFVTTGNKAFALNGVQPYTPSNPRVMLSGFVEIDYETGRFENSSASSAYNGQYTAGGGASYAPEFGKDGFLVFLGGIATNQPILQRDTFADMSVVSLYDIDQRKWYQQKTTGAVPPGRFAFCTVSAKSPNGSYEIFIYGGLTNTTYDRSFPDDENFKNVFALSLPAFRWFRFDDKSQVRRATHTCQIGANSQMIVVGGLQPSSLESFGMAEDPWMQGIGVFDLNSQKWARLYNASAENYTRSAQIESYYRSEYETPEWADPALAGIFAYTSPSRNDSQPPIHTEPQHKPNAGTIGGAVGGGIAALLLAGLIWFFIVRRRRDKKKRQNEQKNSQMLQQQQQQQHQRAVFEMEHKPASPNGPGAHIYDIPPHSPSSPPPHYPSGQDYGFGQGQNPQYGSYVYPQELPTQPERSVHNPSAQVNTNQQKKSDVSELPIH